MKEFNFYSKDARAAAQYCKQHFKSAYDKTLKSADELLEGKFLFREHWEMERTNVPVTFPGAISWELIPAGDPEWIFALNRHTSFLILAKAYAYTEDERYLRRFERICTDWLDNTRLSESSKKGSWRSLEAGIRIENWLRAMEIFTQFGVLDPSLKKRMDASFLVHAQYLKETHGEFQRLSNWGVLQDHGLFLLGLYFGDSAMADMAAERLEREIHMQVMRDGSHWEQSPMYHAEVLHGFLDSLMCAKRHSYAMPAALEDSARNMAFALGKWIKPDGRLVAQGDSDTILARDLVAGAAVLFGDGELKHYARGEVFEENIWDYGTEFIADYEQINTVVPACASVALEDSGNYFMRTSHEADAAWLHFHCGCLGSGHGHADMLHIDVAAFGEDVLIDAGRYTYVDNSERREIKRQTAHNTTRVDKEDASVPIDSWGYSAIAAPLKGQYCFTDKADYVRGAHLGYQNLAGGSVLCSRRVLFIKPDIFVICDEFYAEGMHQYEQYFHFCHRGKLKSIDNGAEYTGRKVSAKLINVSGDDSRFGSILSSREYNKSDESAEVCFSHTGSGFDSSVTVLSVSETDNQQAFTAELIPVLSSRRDGELAKDKATGLRIVKNGKETVVLLAHAEIVSEVELLELGGYLGYGKTIVFGDGFDKDGLVLEW